MVRVRGIPIYGVPTAVKVRFILSASIPKVDEERTIQEVRRAILAWLYAGE